MASNARFLLPSVIPCGVCGGLMKKMLFNVEGITCGGCVRKITNKFAQDSQIEKVEVSDDKKQVVFQGSDELSGMTIKSELEELGFEVLGFEKV